MAKKYSYTPGPWQYESCTVYAPDGTTIAHMERDANKARSISPTERDANAHTIALLPDLISALETLAWDAREKGSTWRLEIAEAVLSKIRTEESS